MLRSLICTSLIVTYPLIAEEISEPQERAELHSSFIRGIMQPIGIPFVSFYHNMRDNHFLNTHVSHPNPLEAIGDFFLTPSRYLFVGQRIAVEEEQNNYPVKQHYSYKRKHWFKTLISCATLPISYTAGVTFKGISYLFPKVRRKHRAICREQAKVTICSHLDQYKQKGFPELYSDEHTPCLHHKRPSGLTRRQRIEIQALKDIASMLDAHGVPYWIDCGTYLGAYRYGGIIPWDWDIDISILLDDHDNVKNLLSTLDPNKYQVQDWSSYTKPNTFLKLYVKETKNFIDIYHYEIDEENQTIAYLFTYADSPFPMSWKIGELKQTKPVPYTQVFPLKKAYFDGLTVWAPCDTVPYLQSKYEANLDPAMVWNEEKKTYDRVENHPYWINKAER